MKKLFVVYAVVALLVIFGSPLLQLAGGSVTMNEAQISAGYGAYGSDIVHRLSLASVFDLRWIVPFLILFILSLPIVSSKYYKTNRDVFLFSSILAGVLISLTGFAYLVSWFGVLHEFEDFVV